MCFWWAMAESRASLCRWLGVQTWTMSICGVLGDGAVVGGRHVGPDRLPGLLGGLRPAGDDVGDPGRKRHRVVEQRQVQVAVGVDLADEAEAEDADVVDLHGNLPRSSGASRPPSIHVGNPVGQRGDNRLPAAGRRDACITRCPWTNAMPVKTGKGGTARPASSELSGIGVMRPRLCLYVADYPVDKDDVRPTDQWIPKLESQRWQRERRRGQKQCPKCNAWVKGTRAKACPKWRLPIPWKARGGPRPRTAGGGKKGRGFCYLRADSSRDRGGHGHWRLRPPP